MPVNTPCLSYVHTYHAICKQNVLSIHDLDWEYVKNSLSHQSAVTVVGTEIAMLTRQWCLSRFFQHV